MQTSSVRHNGITASSLRKCGTAELRVYGSPRLRSCGISQSTSAKCAERSIMTVGIHAYTTHPRVEHLPPRVGVLRCEDDSL